MRLRKPGKHFEKGYEYIILPNLSGIKENNLF